MIRSSGRIPKTPVRPVPGDAYPLGALPVGAEICLVEFLPGDFKMVKYYKAKNSVTILRKEGDRVIIACTVPGVTYSLDQRCMAVVGKVSIHPLKDAPIGTPLRARSVFSSF